MRCVCHIKVAEPTGLEPATSDVTGQSLCPVYQPDMVVLQAASSDPIFYAHHNNIDRPVEV